MKSERLEYMEAGADEGGEGKGPILYISTLRSVTQTLAHCDISGER